MKTLNNPTDRAELVRRLKTVAPDARGQFGTLTAPRMIAHLIDATRMAMGEVEGLGPGLPVLSWPPFKQLILYVLPIPKAKAKTAPQLLATSPTEMASDVDRLCGLMERFARPETKVGATHPAFGSMTRASWGILAYKHTDHHLRQFGA
jgi:hypothetical protein